MTLTATRRTITRRLGSLPLPAAFAAASVAAEALILAKPRRKRTEANRRDLRRLADKARKLEGAS